MILYAILGLLFVVMIVLAVLSAKKDWHWLNPVLLVFIFLAGSAGMIGMAQTLHLQRTVLKKIDSVREQVERAEAQRQEILYGDLNSSEYSPTSLRGLSQKVELMQLGRGREWSGGQVVHDNGNIVFTFSAEQQVPENEDMSLEQVELFAFADQQLTILVDGQPTQVSTPVSFVGKFLVIEQTSTQLTLVPSVPIADFAEYGQPKAGTWSLFERMPFDRHGVFKEVAKMTDENFDVVQFRNFLTNEALPPARVGIDPTSAEYERLIDSFAFDGMSKGKIDAWVETAQNRISPRFEPESGELFVRYKFSGNSTESYTVDDKTGKLDTDGTFSVQGHAVDPLLHLSPGVESRDVTFKKDDIVEIDQATADGYQRADGTVVPPFAQREPNATRIDQIYRRKLVDFPYEMTKLYNRRFQVDNETARLVSNNEVQDSALADRASQSEDKLREIAAYQNDNKRLQNDLDQVQAALQEREKLVSDNQARIEKLESSLDAMRRAIEVRSQSIGATTR